MKLLSLVFEELVLPLMLISMALFVSVGYIISSFVELTIDLWQTVFWLSLIIPLILLVARVRNRFDSVERNPVRLSWLILLPIVVPLLVLFPGLYVIIANPTMQVLSHPDLHFGYINQVIYGETPLESVFVAGYPANYYWLYHAYVATIVKVTSIKAPYIASFLNIAAIVASFLWIAKSLVLLGLAKPRTLYLGALVVFVYCSVNLTGVFSLIASFVNDTFEPNNLRVLLLDGATRNLHSSLAKILNINTTNLGIAIFVAALFTCLRIIRDGINLLFLITISACGIIGLAFLQIATLYIVISLLGGVALICAMSMSVRHDRLAHSVENWRGLKGEIPPASLFLWLVCSVSLSIPLVKYGVDSAYNLRGGVGYHLLSTTNVGTVVGALALLLPLFFGHIILAFRRGDFAEYYVLSSGFLGLLLALGFTIHYDNNQYKGIYFLSILVSISALFVLKRLREGKKRHWRLLGYWIAFILFLLMSSRLLFVEHYLINRPSLDKYGGFGYDGNHIVHVNDIADRFDAYYWIRDNTSSDSIIVIPLDSFIFSNVLMERQLYVKRSQFNFTDNIPDYDRRVKQLNRFFRDDTNLDSYNYMRRNMFRKLPDRTIYAVVKDSEVSPQVMAGRGAELVFEHEADGANAYKLNPVTGA